MVSIVDEDTTGKPRNTHKRAPGNTAPGSERSHNEHVTIDDILTDFGNVVRVSRELTEYKHTFRELMPQQLQSRNFDPNALTVFDLTAETNGLNFLYMEYNDGKSSFAFCEYFEETFSKADSFIPTGGNYENDMNYENYGQNNIRNIETMDEKCKEAIKSTVDKYDGISVKIPYVTNAIDVHSYRNVAMHVQYIVQQISSIYMIRSTAAKVGDAFPRKKRINMHYVSGDRLRDIMTSLYPNSILPRCDAGIVATSTNTQNRFGTGPGETKPLGILAGYVDFIENANDGQPLSPLQSQSGQYTPVFKTTSVINRGSTPFSSLMLISYAYQFFCGEGKWPIHMREENFLHNIANIGNLFYTRKGGENSKQEMISCKHPTDVDPYTASSACFTPAVMALEIVDAHFADPILKLIDANQSANLLGYLRNFTGLSIPDQALQSIIFSKTISIVGTIIGSIYEKNSIEMDSRYLTTYLNALRQFPETHQDFNLKAFLRVNDQNLMRKMNYLDKNTNNRFNKKFKCNCNILSPAFFSLIAEIVTQSNINLIGDQSHNGHSNLDNGALKLGGDFFSKFSEIPTMGNTGTTFNIQNNTPFNNSPF